MRSWFKRSYLQNQCNLKTEQREIKLDFYKEKLGQVSKDPKNFNSSHSIQKLDTFPEDESMIYIRICYHTNVTDVLWVLLSLFGSLLSHNINRICTDRSDICCTRTSVRILFYSVSKLLIKTTEFWILDRFYNIYSSLKQPPRL